MRGRVSAMSDEKKVSVDSILKNALHWKQWMADDLKILLEVSRNEKLSDKALHALIMHHLKTYTLVNQSFSHITGRPDSDLFELPNLDYLKEILPGLDLSGDDVDTVIEPMLELELDGLSKELREETLNLGEKKVVETNDDTTDMDDDEPLIKVTVEDDVTYELGAENDNDNNDNEDDVIIDDAIDDDVYDIDEMEDVDSLDDLLEDEDIIDDYDDYDDTLDDDTSNDDFEDADDSEEVIPKMVDVQESKVETKDLVGKLWDNIVLDDVKLGLNKGDADIGDGY